MIKVLCSAALVVAVVFAAACGDDDDGNEGDGGNQPQATSADAGNGSSTLPGIDDITPAAPAADIPPLDPTAEVQVTDSGLRYIDEVVGTGPAIQSGQIVTVNYSGWLTDGTLFDSSLNPGRTPFQFPVGTQRVIAGWDEGVGSMNVGGKRRLIIPAELGYGERGSGRIPPGAVLIFDVEVLGAE